MESTEKHPRPEALDKLSAEDIIAALNNKEATESLMKEHNIDREQFLARAEFIAKRLAAGIAMVNCV
ncbi:hypothetical protein [uncultured Methylobacterium sp.]|uniref:hypothetical protein n=1 Tax=uncultured Methylobacterium sp. TaxID=157278 RepID=UPI002613F9A0|nr:hypothetical protein [uncultured Methylobacterium sp.]